ncbi:hypothetical protein [uncultured Paraglaciecola sp.]|uniref:hypothetical protein n=1 Tax=uncultured Paraglaciecola sp. TaxID=1765024 RepID=UPI00261E58C1|nr:hypothetical protein [uncultured Paraglaciecola sp.]
MTKQRGFSSSIIDTTFTALSSYVLPNKLATATAPGVSNEISGTGAFNGIGYVVGLLFEYNRG